jgi:hypothetical protein
MEPMAWPSRGRVLRNLPVSWDALHPKYLYRRLA